MNIDEIYETLHGLTHNLESKALSNYFDLSDEDKHWLSKKFSEFLNAIFEADRILDEMKKGE